MHQPFPTRARYRASVIVQSTERTDDLADRFLRGLGTSVEKVTARRLSPALTSLRAEINVSTLDLAREHFSAGLAAIDRKTIHPLLRQWVESTRTYQNVSSAKEGLQ